MTLEAVLFDLDGLLVDSEPLQFYAYRDAFSDFGIQLDLDGWYRWHRVEASISRWVADEGHSVDPEAVRAVKKKIYDRMIATELRVKTGAARLVESCADHFRLAVVSGSRVESIESCLARFGLDSYFELFVSSTELPHSKPYPDPYLEALRRLQLTASNCIAIEDSASGLKAARAAGIPCIVCPDGFTPQAEDAFVAAARVVPSLQQLDVSDLIDAHRQAFGDGT